MADKMAEIIKKASELAQHAPESLQAAAFQKAFDALMEQEDGGEPTGAPRRKRKGKSSREARHPGGDEARSLDHLDRTAHSEIDHKQSVLNNSLRLLRAAREDLGIDGLSASEIARVLTEKFRAAVTRQGVSLALNQAGRYVDRRKDGNAVVFRIMAPGEEYLDSDRGDAAKPSPPRRGRKTKRKKGTENSASKTSKKRASKRRSNGQSTTKQSTRRSVGPTTMLDQFIADGFFSSARTISDVIEHAKDMHGRTFKRTDLSPTLVRFLRAGKLARAKNADGQYEYRRP